VVELTHWLDPSKENNIGCLFITNTIFTAIDTETGLLFYVPLNTTVSEESAASIFRAGKERHQVFFSPEANNYPPI
jgi:hypothetical protein